MLQLLTLFILLTGNCHVNNNTIHGYFTKFPWNYYNDNTFKFHFWLAVLIISVIVFLRRKRLKSILDKLFLILICIILLCLVSLIVLCVGGALNSLVDNLVDAENVELVQGLVLSFVMLVCFGLSINIISRRYIAKRISTHLKYIASVVLLLGFILFMIGYSHNIEGESYLYVLSFLQASFRAVVSAFGMFVFDTDFIEVGEAYHHNIWYLTAFAIVHFLGVFVTTFFILRLLGEKFLSGRQMSRILNNEKGREIFVFWGINEESITLAESIKKKYDAGKKEAGDEKDAELLFVETPSEKELEIKEHSLSHFFNSSIYGSSEKDRIYDKGISGTILYPNRRLIDVDKELSYKNKNSKNDRIKKIRKILKIKGIFKKLGLSKLFELCFCHYKNLYKKSKKRERFQKLGLSKLYKLCERSHKVHFFFLSDDEQKNIQDTLIIQDIFKWKTEGDKLHLYCKSRNNYANRAIINNGGLFVTTLIDDAALSITTLKEKRDNGDYIAHPVNFVNPDPERGVARNPFTALIIGFGTAGQDALRFIYEYGSFIKSSEEELPFKCYVIDREMNNIKGQFVREVPMLESDNQPDSMKNIEFWNCDWNSEEFKEKFTSEMLNELNYVVIATGEDKSNTTIAAELYEYALKNRKEGLDNFHIFVRVYNKENEKQMEAVSDFYTDNDRNDKKITVFGRQCEIYTYENIIEDEENVKKATVFYEIYLEVAGYQDESWGKREADIKDKKTSYANRLKYIYQRGQDYSNVLHAYTKLKLCKYTEEGMPSMNEFKFDVKSYPEKDKQRLVCYRNLSELEHIRWNAASYMAGFVYAEEKDFRKKTHPCLRPFKELKDGDRLKDYATVITTIELNKKK